MTSTQIIVIEEGGGQIVEKDTGKPSHRLKRKVKEAVEERNKDGGGGKSSGKEG